MKKRIFKSESEIPIWLMRQAGRYLPEYMKIRKSVNSFLDLCYNPEKAAEVTLQPIKRFNFDASIIFSDILVLPNAMGWNVKFEDNIGPILRNFESEEDLELLNCKELTKLENVYLAINIVRASLPKNISLIGFVGGPWTVASYMIEGKSSKDFSLSKRFIYEKNDLAKKLIDLLTEQSINHLLNQIKAGVDVVQLFDSHAGMLNEPEYTEFVINPTKKIIDAIRKNFPNVPIIGFPRNSGTLYKKYAELTQIDVISIDQFTPLSYIKESFKDNIVVQGNLDPIILLTNKEIIRNKVDEILSELNDIDLIFNLGHGVLPATPLENIEFLVNYVKNFRK